MLWHGGTNIRKTHKHCNRRSAATWLRNCNTPCKEPWWPITHREPPGGQEVHALTGLNGTTDRQWPPLFGSVATFTPCSSLSVSLPCPLLQPPSFLKHMTICLTRRCWHLAPRVVPSGHMINRGFDTGPRERVYYPAFLIEYLLLAMIQS